MTEDDHNRLETRLEVVAWRTQHLEANLRAVAGMLAVEPERVASHMMRMHIELEQLRVEGQQLLKKVKEPVEPDPPEPELVDGREVTFTDFGDTEPLPVVRIMGLDLARPGGDRTVMIPLRVRDPGEEDPIHREIRAHQRWRNAQFRAGLDHHMEREQARRQTAWDRFTRWLRGV